MSTGNEILREWREEMKEALAELGPALPDLSKVHWITCTMADLKDKEKICKILEQADFPPFPALLAKYLEDH